MRDKLINFFFKIENPVEYFGKGNTFSMSCKISPKYGHLGIFVWWLLETIRSKIAK